MFWCVVRWSLSFLLVGFGPMELSWANAQPLSHDLGVFWDTLASILKIAIASVHQRHAADPRP